MNSVELLLLIIFSTVTTIKSCSPKIVCSIYTYKNYNDRKRVLSMLPDSYVLSQISLIGTHQSMTYSASDNLRKQELNINEQLNYGVRVFDISVRIKTNYFGIYYRSTYLETSFNVLVDEIDNFLKSNPQEFVVLIMNIDHPNGASQRNDLDVTYCEILADYLAKYVGGKRILSNWSIDNNIYQLRGKILLSTYDISFAGCANWLGAKCLLTNKLDYVDNNFFYSHYDVKYEDIDRKWIRYMKFVASNAFNHYPCYIYDLSIYDETHYSRGAAKYGGYDINGKCFVPMNYRIDSHCRGDHRPAFNIFLVDYVTQEVIDHINGLNFHYYNSFERMLLT